MPKTTYEASAEKSQNRRSKKVTVEDLYDIVLVGDAQISPDGGRVAYVRKEMDKQKDEYKTNIWIWDEGECRPYSQGGKDSSPRWSADGAYLGFLSKRGKKVQIFVLPSEGGEARSVTPDDYDVTAFDWSPDGKQIAFLASLTWGESEDEPDEKSEGESSDGKGAKEDKKKPPTKLIERAIFKFDGMGFIHNRRSHIHVVDVETGEVRQLTEGDYYAGAPAWSPDGKHVAFSANRNPRWDVEIDSQIWQVPVEGGELRQISKERGSWFRPFYSPNGEHIAFLGFRVSDDEASGFSQIWKVDRQGDGLVNLIEGRDLDVGNEVINDAKAGSDDSPKWNEEGLWFIASEAGSSNIYRLSGGKLRPETEGRHEIQGFSVSGDTLAYVRSDALHPPEAFLRRPRAAAEQITESNAELLSRVRLSDPKPIEFPGSQGETVGGWLMHPTGRSGVASPAIIYVHGGPQAAYGWSFFHEMQFLAGEGFGILLINPHGSASYGERWETAIFGGWGGRDFEDVMAATDYLAGQDWVDDKRIAIAGGSYGGYMGSWAIGHTDRFAAAVVERSLVNMLSFVGTTDGGAWWDYAWKASIEKDPMKLWEMSPIAYLSNMKTPTLVIHSENDHRCPVEQGEQIFTGLRRQGVATRFVRFPGES
ncbi:MAG TPA: S9 family peptidase, partial [Chloroflexota bacterium]|nr:S9 family peptidase [Chloroflexota bacterium]